MGIPIWEGIKTIFTSWVDLKKSKNEAQAKRYAALAQAEADWDTEALKQSQFSWKDELITIVWVSPLVIAWFDEGKATAWVKFVSGLPHYYWFGMFGIMAASFGLRWYFKQQGFQVPNK